MTKPCYDVGYGKPPLHTRFRKGQSGNPKGRGKGTKNFATTLMKAMSEPVTINENGNRKKISKLAAAVTQLANDAARGDKKSIQLAFACGRPSNRRSRPTKAARSDCHFRRAGGE